MTYKTDVLRYKVYARHGDMCSQPHYTVLIRESLEAQS